MNDDLSIFIDLTKSEEWYGDEDYDKLMEEINEELLREDIYHRDKN